MKNSKNSSQDTAPKRIYLSPPHMSGAELELVQEAFASNWIAPLGPHVDAFEKEVAARVGTAHAAALSSGTAAIHLALRLLKVRPDDEVLCSNFTFCASANPIVYEGAQPVFVDSDTASWNMDPNLLEDELRDMSARGKRPKAVVCVDLYGQCADYEAIERLCAAYDVPLIEDAAEALGATYKGKAAGAFGRCGVFSFNGNKIITTSGGGMLVSDDEELIAKARFLATQARDPAPHFEHSTIGFNYRMSNVLAAIGRGQLKVLDERVKARCRNYDLYRATLEEVPGIAFMPRASHGEPTCWLTCITIDPQAFGAAREDVRLALEKENIEARPVWKPMHLQPVFESCRVRGGCVAQRLFENGLCLPSGSSLTEGDLHRICTTIRNVHHQAAGQGTRHIPHQ